MLKRFITSLFCLFLILASFPIWGYTSFLCAPVYADSTLDNWRDATTNEEFAEAFRYYCKSRDLTIQGTVANVLTNGTTNIFNALCDGIGINMTALQGHIKYEVDSSGNKGLKWLFDSQGITFYNRLFAQFLQDNDLEVGDSANQTDNTIYSGKTFTDLDGNTCLVYILNHFSSGGYDTEDLGGELLAFGTPYKYSLDDLLALWDPNTTLNFHVATNYSYTGSFYMQGSLFKACSFSGGSRNYFYIESTDPAFDVSGHYIIAYSVSQDAYYFGSYSNNRGSYEIKGNRFYIDQSNDVQNAVLYLTTNNTVINNNNYEGDTIINNEGDVINEPSPGGKDPGWDVGGGQGSYEDNSGNSYTINFPDFELPDLNIDWSIQGLGNKFPFSIPFDIASLVSVLNAEPEAPRFEGTVNFGFTTWDYDINLEQFDSVAHACRIAELLLLVFGLILITRSIIKG